MSPDKSFMGTTDFFVNANVPDVTPQSWFFNFTFASALSSIVASTVAERSQMKACLLFSMFLVGFIHLIVAHSIWSTNNFLSKFNVEPLLGSGAIDLAGSCAVHFAGGVAAFVGGLVLGPCLGRFYVKNGVPLEKPVEFSPHNVGLQMLGTFCVSAC